MATSTKEKPAATQPATKKQPAKGRPAKGGNVSVQDIAAQLQTTPKALRARLRGMKNVSSPGKGGRYTFTKGEAATIVKALSAKKEA